MHMLGRSDQFPGISLGAGAQTGQAAALPSREGGLPLCVTADFRLDWAVCGSGVLTWSVFRLYRATLYAPGSFDPGRPYAIDLNYLRRITADQIVTASVSEIERLRAPGASDLALWRDALAALIPDVTLGGRLVGVFIPDQGVVFYSATQRLGEIPDARFAEAFGAIWLDPQTRSPTLRLAMLGEGRPV